MILAFSHSKWYYEIEGCIVIFMNCANNARNWLKIVPFEPPCCREYFPRNRKILSRPQPEVSSKNWFFMRKSMKINDFRVILSYFRVQAWNFESVFLCVSEKVLSVQKKIFFFENFEWKNSKNRKNMKKMFKILNFSTIFSL